MEMFIRAVGKEGSNMEGGSIAGKME